MLYASQNEEGGRPNYNYEKLPDGGVLGWPKSARPSLNRKHVDGPLLTMRNGELHWLTFRERISLRFGKTDAIALERKYRPDLSAFDNDAPPDLKYRELTDAERKNLHEKVTFTVTCTMKRRWAQQFIGMLKQMQRLGSWGSSRNVSFFADGDGDYRPKFEFSGIEGIVPAEPHKLANGDTSFDAG